MDVCSVRPPCLGSASWLDGAVNRPNVTRLLSADDAPALARLVVKNRKDFEPWEPVRNADYYTTDGQRAAILALLERLKLGLTLPHAIITADGEVAGRITLDNISRGAFQSCTVGYWVSEDRTGQGLASAALEEICQIAFNDLGLHRIEAGTLLHNARSQRVLAKNGFVEYGKAPAYIKIAGRWQDHLLFQRLSPAP